MRNLKWLAALVAVLAVGLIAAGCGGDDDETTAATVTEATTTTEDEATTEDETTSEDTSAEGSTPDDVYNACIDVIEGTPAEEASKPACEQARDAFQQCLDQADAAGGDAGDTAAQLCQDAADQTIDTLKTAGAATG
jgi:hypothetical protein